MCAVSQVGDYWANNFPQRYPNIPMAPQPFYPFQTGGVPMYTTPMSIINPVTQEQFEALRKEVAELKELLLAAKKFDEATGQPDCHTDEKVELIRNVAKMVGIDMKDVFPDGNPD